MIMVAVEMIMVKVEMIQVRNELLICSGIISTKRFMILSLVKISCLMLLCITMML